MVHFNCPPCLPALVWDVGEEVLVVRWQPLVVELPSIYLELGACARPVPMRMTVGGEIRGLPVMHHALGVQRGVHTHHACMQGIMH